MIPAFSNPIGLLALLSLIPLLILYLIRPKPKEITIPSLIFLKGNKQFKSRRSFFQQILNDPLLLLQLLILLFIALYFSAPYLTSGSVHEGTVLLVIDTSASVGSKEMFQQVKQSALNNLGGSTTIVTLSHPPQILLREGDAGDARDALNNLQPGGGRSSIAEGMYIAETLAQSLPGTVTTVVISDFDDTEGGNVQEALNSLQKHTTVLTIPLTPEQKNVGFTSLTLSTGESTAVITNFCCDTQTVMLKGVAKDIELILPQGNTHTYSFTLPQGKTTLKLDVDDALPADDTLTLVNEQGENAHVLVIGSKENKHLIAALKASPQLIVDTTTPGTIPKKKYDVYILDQIPTLSGGLATTLENVLSSGHHVIIIPSSKSKGNLGGFLPYTIDDTVGGGQATIVRDTALTKDLSLGRQQSVRQITCAEECEGVYVTAGSQPIMMITPVGKGTISYYGVLEEGFENRPDYPLLWTRLVKQLAGVRDIHSMNVLSGTVLLDNGHPVVLDTVGSHSLNGKGYGVNLLSEKESTIQEQSIASSESSETTTTTTITQPLWKPLLLIALFFILLEWIYLNRLMRRKRYRV